MKAKEFFGWTLFVLFIAAVVVVSSALGPSVYKWLQSRGTTIESAAKVEAIQPQLVDSPKEPEVLTKENAQVIFTEPVSESTTLTFGELGTYKCVYDTNRKQWTIGQWTENQISTGTMTLADLKRDGGKISFTMPAKGWINNSAGKLFVDGKQWDLGNYGEIDRMTQNTLIQKGQIVSVEYGPENDSAGFQIWFQN